MHMLVEATEKKKIRNQKIKINKKKRNEEK